MKKAKDKTLCKLIKKKILEEDFGSYAELVRGSRFICKKCGRAAESKKRLCKPIQM